MINIFEIPNMEAISPEMKGHDILLNSNVMGTTFLETEKPKGPMPYFWTHCTRYDNPHLTKEYIIDAEGWVCRNDDQKQTHEIFLQRIDQNADILKLGTETKIMFQNPRVSYAHVLLKRSKAVPFENQEHDGTQIWFDLWTPYHDSVPEAERFFRGYNLFPDTSKFERAMKFVELNLEKYIPRIYGQK